MKTFVRHLVTALTVAVACQAGIAMAEDFYWVSTDAKAAAPAVPEKAAAPAQSACTSCCEGTCCEESTGCCGCDLGCDECPCRGLVGFAGVDTFKGVSNAFLPNNLGAVAGLNAAIPVPGLSDYGIGWQLGMSYGVYDFDGRVSAVNPAQSEEQTFVTTGFYHKAACDSRLSFGMVYDWMLNSNWGALGTTPTLGQWRGQVEYALSGCNAVGAWGCRRDLGSVQTTTLLVPGVTNMAFDSRTRAITQFNLFWHHKFVSGADSYLWFGIPDHGTFDHDGSLGDWMIGANVQVPLTDALALYANASYFHPSAAAGVIGAYRGWL